MAPDPSAPVTEPTDIDTAMQAALAFLDRHDPAELLDRVGQTIEELPTCVPPDKAVLPRGYGGGASEPTDDLLAARGMFYITEQRKLFLDATSGHYQMPWGYNPRWLCDAIADATARGIVWDNHSSIPQAPVKQLAAELVAAANAPGCADPLDRILIGVCTGSAACEAALKIQLLRHEALRGRDVPPVVIVIEGNYHGTGIVSQRLRGMWPSYVSHLQVVTVEPNDIGMLQQAFADHADRVAGFWTEPILMNREAIVQERDYLLEARRLCDHHDALMCIDEIQTGFWHGGIFAFRDLQIEPDLVVIGKGMTAGFHPLSGLLFKSREDRMEQYDALNTNGGAALASFVGLCNMQRLREDADHIDQVGRYYHDAMIALRKGHDRTLEAVTGRSHMTGLRFRRVEDALAFHQRAVDAGLWVRVHAYHEGHRTLLTKLGVVADQQIVDYFVARLDTLLSEMSGV